MAPDEEVRSVSATGGEKGTKPARYDLIPTGPLNLVARLYGRGAAKYAERNWERGYEWSKSYAAMQRHLNQFWSGEWFDEEMVLPHLAAAVFHAFALLEFFETHPELDDRPTTIAKRAAAGLAGTEDLGELKPEDVQPYLDQMDATLREMARTHGFPMRVLAGIPVQPEPAFEVGDTVTVVIEGYGDLDGSINSVMPKAADDGGHLYLVKIWDPYPKSFETVHEIFIRPNHCCMECAEYERELAEEDQEDAPDLSGGALPADWADIGYTSGVLDGSVFFAPAFIPDGSDWFKDVDVLADGQHSLNVETADGDGGSITRHFPRVRTEDLGNGRYKVIPLAAHERPLAVGTSVLVHWDEWTEEQDRFFEATIYESLEHEPVGDEPRSYTYKVWDQATLRYVWVTRSDLYVQA